MKKFETRRSAKRVQVEMPVQLEKGRGVTRDISSAGVYFFTDRSFTAGMDITFELEFKFVFPGEAVRLNCRGKVMRVEQAGERTGVAASISEVSNAA